jgi:large subunit ribosomal protein L22
VEVIARSRYIRRAPRKARLIADMVRGMRVADALAQLEFSPKHAAVDVAKAIKSAAANAEHNHQLARDQLWLKSILVDEGPTLKRIRPVSRGMAHQYFHRTCHITAIVEDRSEPEQVARPARRRPAAPRPEPAAPSRPGARARRERGQEEDRVAGEDQDQVQSEVEQERDQAEPTEGED